MTSVRLTVQSSEWGKYPSTICAPRSACKKASKAEVSKITLFIACYFQVAFGYAFL